MDGWAVFSYIRPTRRRGTGNSPMGGSLGDSSSRYKASISNPKASTRSRWWETVVLLTYRGENGPREPGDGEAARELGDNGSGDFWWCFTSRNGSGGGSDGGGQPTPNPNESRKKSKRGRTPLCLGLSARPTRRGCALSRAPGWVGNGLGRVKPDPLSQVGLAGSTLDSLF
jgi:hypothetical protein